MTTTSMPRSKPVAAKLSSRERGELERAMGGVAVSYVAAGYGITAVVLVAYSAWVLLRGRAR